MARHVLGRAFILVLLLLGIQCICVSQDALGQIGDRTHVEVSIDPDPAEVDTSPTGSNSVFLNVTAKVTTLPGVITVIEITLDTGEWPSQADQAIKQVTGNGEAVFEVEVVAPFDATAGTDQVVTVTIDWHTTTPPPESGREEAQSVIKVKKFYDVNVYIPTTWRSAKQGESISLDIKVYNQGNTRDIIKVWIENEDDLEGEGWYLELDDVSVQLDPQNNSKTLLHIDVASDATPEERYVIIIMAKSMAGEDAGEPAEDMANITINVKSSGGGGGGGGGGNGGDNNTTKPSEPSTPCQITGIMLTAPFLVMGLGISRSRVRGWKGGG